MPNGGARERNVLESLDADDRATLESEIDRVLDDRIRDIRLTARLARLYREVSARQRSRIIGGWLKTVILLSILTIGLDFILSPTTIGLSVLLRGVLIPIVYGSLIVIVARPRPAWVEGLTLPVAAGAMMVVAGILNQQSGSPHNSYVIAGLFAVSTGIVIFPVGQVWTSFGAVTTLGVYLGFGLLNPAVPLVESLTYGVFFACAISGLIPARRSMTIVLHQAFLLTVRSALQSEALEAANARLAVLAHTDGLTQLANRRAFEEEASRLWARPGEPASAVGVVLIDIDHFKPLNDAAGHAAGDECLSAIAHVIRRTVPDATTVARYGGEEFICVVGDAAPRALLELAEAVRAGVEALGYPHPGLGPGRVATVSVGVAVAISDRRSTGLAALIREADAALYRAKDAGRNRVVPAWEPIAISKPLAA